MPRLAAASRCLRALTLSSVLARIPGTASQSAVALARGKAPTFPLILSIADRSVTNTSVTSSSSSTPTQTPHSAHALHKTTIPNDSPHPYPSPFTTTNAPSSDSTATHFGFTSVPLDEKQHLVHRVFERAAPSYDLMNDAMSLAVHRLWKRALVATLAPTPSMRILDCAGGTADVAMRILAHTHNHPRYSRPNVSRHHHHEGNVVVCDINPQMLAVGKQRAAQKGWSHKHIRFVEGNAENLPFQDNSFDAYVISFGMRNVPRPEVALAEAVRVLRPGGRFLMLEFAEITNNIPLSTLYDLYSFRVIPSLGKIIANDADSYQYLVESIRQFPKQQECARMMSEAGLKHVTVNNYTFGVAAEYSGFKFAAAQDVVSQVHQAST